MLLILATGQIQFTKLVIIHRSSKIFWQKKMLNYQVSLRRKSRKIWVSCIGLKIKSLVNCNLGSSDFFGVNHYTTSLVGWCQAGTDGCDWGYYQTRCSNWPTAGSSWLASNPYGDSFKN